MYLPETGEWTEGVFLIEEEHDVLGYDDGNLGIDNLPLLDLANRTSYLKKIFGTVVEV